MIRKYIKKIKKYILVAYKNHIGIHVISAISNLALIYFIYYNQTKIEPYDFDGYKDFIIYTSVAIGALVITVLSATLLLLTHFLMRVKTFHIKESLLSNKIYVIWFCVGILINFIACTFAVLFILFLR